MEVSAFTDLTAVLSTLEHVLHREFDVLIDGEPRKKRVVLEYHRAIRPGFRHLPAIEDDPTRGGAQ